MLGCHGRSPPVISQVTPMSKSKWALDNINVYAVTNSQFERMITKKMKHHWQHTPDNWMYSLALAEPASWLDTSLGYKSNPSHRVRILVTIPASMENLKITTRQTNFPKLRSKHTHSQNHSASQSLSESHVQLTVACATYNHRQLEPYLSLDYLP